MRCGYCQKTGVDIEHVRNRLCNTTGAADKFGDSGMTEVKDAPEFPASERQIDYVLGLQNERLLPEHWVVWDRGTLELLERDEVSAQISLLKSFTKRASDGPAKSDWNMPQGRYALWLAPEDLSSQTISSPEPGEPGPAGAWHFYQVDRPDKGRWKGYTFIKRLVGAPGDYREVDMNRVHRMDVLKRIEADPKTAMVNFGKQTQHCGRCLSPLTHKRSRAAGYGQKCASVLGWEW